jgi:peptide/nickel transport system permease protein
VDKVMLFVLEALIMMPALLVVAVATSGGGNGLQQSLPSWLLLIIVLLVFSWMGTARLIRSLSMSLMTRDFVKAAQYMGVPPRRIVWRHLVPNIGSLLVLDITRGITGAILAEVAFSFIGIGIKVPDVSLGVLIGQATSQVSTFPWMFWVPLTVMFLLTGSLAMMNDGLRDAFDPNSSSVGRAKKGDRGKSESGTTPKTAQKKTP